MPKGFPTLKEDAPWIGITGDLLEVGETSAPEPLKRGVQKGPSSRQMAFMLGHKKPASKDRTDETLGAAQVVLPPTRNTDANRRAGRELLGHTDASSNQTPASTIPIPQKRLLPILKGKDSEVRRAVRGELSEVAEQTSAVSFKLDAQEYEPEGRSAHDIAAKEVASLRASGLSASMGDFRIAHSGIDTLVPLSDNTDRESRELLWKIFQAPTSAPFSVAAKSMDTWLTSRLADEIQSVRHASGLDHASLAHRGARAETSDTNQLRPLDTFATSAFTGDIYKTLSAMTAIEFQNDPLTLEKAGGYALSILEASGHHVAAFKSKGIEALGRVLLGLLDIKTAEEGAEAQLRNDALKPTRVGASTSASQVAPLRVFDLRDAMKDDGFRVAFAALQDSSMFYEPSDMIVSDLSSILRREDPACSNERSADLLHGVLDAHQVFSARGRDKVNSARVSMKVGDANATRNVQQKNLLYVDRSVEPAVIGDVTGRAPSTPMKVEHDVVSKQSVIGDARARVDTQEARRVKR